MATFTTANAWTRESIGYDSFEVYSGKVQLLLGDTWLSKRLLPFCICINCSHIFLLHVRVFCRVVWLSVISSRFWMSMSSSSLKESAHFSYPQGLPIWSYFSALYFSSSSSLCMKYLDHWSALSTFCRAKIWHANRDCRPHNHFNENQFLPIETWIVISTSTIVYLASRNCSLNFYR